VGRAFDVLELLCKHPNGLRQTDISQALGIPKSSTHALVAVLVERRYLRKDAEKKLYFLGPMTNELGSAYLDNSDLEAAAMPVMNEIQRLTGEVVNLSVQEDCDVVLVARVHSTFPLRVVPRIGAKTPAHVSASGKAILATLDDATLESLYAGRKPARPTPRAIGSLEVLRTVLSDVRATGIAYDEEESQDGITAVASAIRGAEGDAIGSLSIVLPAHRMDETLRERYARLVEMGSRIVSGEMGYGPALAEAGTIQDLERLWHGAETESSSD
jgi:DNA-binding IclR family transcriptional regulator